jgi:hypothetical protein
VRSWEYVEEKGSKEYLEAFEVRYVRYEVYDEE